MSSRAVRRGLRAAFVVAAASLMLASPAYAGNIWTIQTAPSPSTGQPIEGGGSWIVNKPSGYYLGRAMVGTRFDVVYTSSSNWHYGRAIENVNMCGWVMPGSMNSKVGSQADSCSATGGVRDQIVHRLTIGRDFNAAAHEATTGTRVPAGSCPFYYNYFYGSDFTSNGGHWANFAGYTSAGYVLYRFTSRDRGAREVRDPNFGWGWVPSSCVGTSSPVYNDND
jgi:hypothetical protein